MAVLYFSDLLWPFALFILSDFLRHATTILGARLLTAMCLFVGILWKVPATASCVDRVAAGYLAFLLDALHGCSRLVATIVDIVGINSIKILAAMRKFRCKMLYQALAVVFMVI